MDRGSSSSSPNRPLPFRYIFKQPGLSRVLEVATLQQPEESRERCFMRSVECGFVSQLEFWKGRIEIFSDALFCQ